VYNELKRNYRTASYVKRWHVNDAMRLRCGYDFR
jgi:hypothetical protein